MAAAPTVLHGSALRSGLVPGATAALVLLLFINMFNYIDRQVLAAVEPAIQKTLFPNGDPYVKFWMGLLSTAFMVAFMLMAPLFGVLADRMSRWKLMAFGVAVWSLASGALRPGGRASSSCCSPAAWSASARRPTAPRRRPCFPTSTRSNAAAASWPISTSPSRSAAPWATSSAA